MAETYKNTLKLWVFMALFAVTGASTFVLSKLPMHEDPLIDLSKVPLQIGDWHGEDQPLDFTEAKIAEKSSFIKRRYMRGTDEIWVIGVSAAEDRHNVHHPRYCYTGSGWNVVRSQTINGSHHSATEVVLQKKDAGKAYFNLERYWFTDGEKSEASYFFQLWNTFEDRLLRRQATNWSVFRVIWLNYEEDSRPHELLDEFSELLMKQYRDDFESGKLYKPTESKNTP